MAELFKFRCYQCEKLLGVSPKKVGRAVQCPQCGTELIVPAIIETEGAEESTEGEATDEFSGLGIDLGFSSPLDLRPVERVTQRSNERPVDEVEAIAFLEQAASSVDPEDSTLGQTNNPDSTSASSQEDFTADPEPEPIVQTPIEPLTTRSRVSRGVDVRVDRRRDVVVPRTAMVAWSLFAILALALSFLAGLMIGHYRWR